MDTSFEQVTLGGLAVASRSGLGVDGRLFLAAKDLRRSFVWSKSLLERKAAAWMDTTKQSCSRHCIDTVLQLKRLNTFEPTLIYTNMHSK
ncbi:hypothetical protein BaRGS_00023753 [Batillaria attramentaria]|uniref:Uncharacterized protein n=1 Tax=Batillaria attramentaria TaxID=370345 RepID=A0ABD0KCY3_9CAEN